MRGGDDEQPDCGDVDPARRDASPAETPHRRPVDPASDPSLDPDVDRTRAGTAVAVDPTLPSSAARQPPAMVSTPVPPVRGTGRWYRSDHDRYRSVRRRANPWYRRLARRVIGLSFLAAAAVGLYLGAQVVQDWLDRDRLPTSGAELPAVRATSFEIRSVAPAPAVDGTVWLDTTTRAFSFRGRGTGPQAGTEVVSTDGSTAFVRRGGDAWTVAADGDQVADDVERAVGYLADDASPDSLLTAQARHGYVELLDRSELGAGDDKIRLYRLRIDTASFAEDFPLQYRDFEDRALPGVQAVRAQRVDVTVDSKSVLSSVEITDAGGETVWSWQRLDYSEAPYTPDLADSPPLPDTPIEITDGNLDP